MCKHQPTHKPYNNTHYITDATYKHTYPSKVIHTYTHKTTYWGRAVTIDTRSFVKQLSHNNTCGGRFHWITEANYPLLYWLNIYKLQHTRYFQQNVLDNITKLVHMYMDKNSFNQNKSSYGCLIAYMLLVHKLLFWFLDIAFVTWC